MTDKWAELTKPFKPEQIGKLPKPYKADSPKGECRECGKYHGLPALHVDYVGHAVLTSRLLAVDPEWTWEPMGTDEHGLPAVDRAGNLWIRLTILGRTRIGVGDGKNAKEAIGDALRNAAMRFGVALELWAKEELETTEQEQTAPPPVDIDPTTLAKRRAWAAVKAKNPGMDNEALTVIVLDALRSIGHPTFESADAAAWDVLAEEWAA